jgi:PE family
MSYVVATPGAFADASQNLTSIGSAIRAAHVAAAGSTTTVVAAAQDEVSTAIAEVFGSYAQGYQTVAGQAAAFHDQFVQALNGAGGSYAATEAANASPLQTANAPARLLELQAQVRKLLLEQQAEVRMLRLEVDDLEVSPS